MEEQDKNPIYNFLRKNNLTKKSEVDFNKEYSSNPDKQKELYDFFVANELTTKDQNAFVSEYFPNADGVSPQGSVGTSQTSIDPIQGTNAQGASTAVPDGGLLGRSSEGNVLSDVSGLIESDSNLASLFPNEIRTVSSTDGSSRYNFLSDPFVSLDQLSQAGIQEPVYNVEGSLIYDPTGQALQRVPEQDMALFRDIEEVTVTATPEQIEQARRNNRLSSWQSMKNSASNVVTQLKGFDDRLSLFAADTWEKVIGRDLAKAWYEYDGRDIDEVRREAYSELDRLSLEMGDTLGIVEGVREGDIGSVAAGVVNAASSLLSTAISSVATAGAGLVTEMAGGAIYDYNTEKAKSLGMTTEKLLEEGKADYWTPAFVGVIGASLERIGLKGVTSAINRKITGSMARKFSVLGVDMNKEGMTEWLQTGLDAYNVAIAQGDSQGDAIEKLAQSLISEEGLESYLQGVAGSASATGAGRAVRGIVDRRSKQTIVEKKNQLIDIANDLSRTDDLVVKSSLIDAASEVSNDIMAAQTQNQETVSSIDESNLIPVMELQSEIDAIDSSISQGGVSDSSISAMESRRDQLESQKESLITEVMPDTSNMTPERIDRNIETMRITSPAMSDAVMGEVEMPDTVFDTLTRVDSNEAVGDSELSSAIDSLYEKKKELISLKNNPDRVHTIEEIDTAISGLDADMERLSGYTTELVMPNINDADLSLVNPGDVFQYEGVDGLVEGVVSSSSIADNGSINVTMSDGTVINSSQTTPVLQEQTNQNEIQETNVVNQDVQVPLEGVEVAPVGSDMGIQSIQTPQESSQELELAIETVAQPQTLQNETTAQTVVEPGQGTGPQDQNVVSEYEQVVRVQQPSQETQSASTDTTVEPTGITSSQTQASAPQTPKGVLKGVSDRLAKTGLAKSVKVANSQTITETLGVDGNNVNGYVDEDGNIVINQDRAGIDTPIHELSHVWERTVERDNPELHARGMDLIQEEDGNPYVQHVRNTQPGLQGNALYKEALAQAIGDRGARLIGDKKQSPIKKWLDEAWKFIGKMVGISGMSPQQIGNLTLNEYADAVAVDLLSGRPYIKLDNGDIIAETESSSESTQSNTEKFMNDFILRMKQKNGVNFQGNIQGGLNESDFKDLVTFFQYGKQLGKISNKSEAIRVAKDMGIDSLGDVEMAYKLSELKSKDATGFKKAEASENAIKGADFTKMSDREYRDVGKQLVDEGLIVPQDLVQDILENPRALQPYEVTALQYYRSQIESQISDASNLIESGDESSINSFSFNGIKGYKGIAAKMDVVNSALFDLEVAMLSTAHQQSAAFRLRSLMSDKDFNIVQYLAEMKATGYVNPELEARLKQLSNELNTVRAKLKAKSAELESMAERLAGENIVHEASLPNRKVVVRPSVKTALNTVLDGIDISSFGLPGISFQANNTIRFQTSVNTPLSDAVSSAISSLRDNVSKGNMSVSDAIETAVSQIDSEVGQGNWDAIKFRSTIANQLVQQSVPIKLKRPYVNSNGVLIVPGDYLKELVKSGDDTIDKMVASTNSYLGDRFSEYDIRNAISGYGRQSSRNKSDLETKISRAKRIAGYMSQIEDLETKGKRLKTGKQVHNNDLEIKNLQDRIKALEYSLEMTPEERAQLEEQKYHQSRIKYLQNYIRQVQDRIDSKDFAPQKRKNKFEDDQETRDLRVESERIKNEFKKEKYRHELENKTSADKARTLAYDVIFNITRGLSAGADASAVGVQGAIFSAARPREAYKLLAASLQGTFSEAEYNNYFAELQSDPLYEYARKAGLNLQLPNFYQSVQEEQFKGSLPELLMNTLVLNPGATLVAKASGRDAQSAREFAQDKLNVFTLGDRNYSLVLSKIRMDLFREFVNNQIIKNGIDIDLDENTVKQVADQVNNITMASKIPAIQGKAANDVVSAIMFSARKFVATWKILGAWAPLLIGPNRNYQLFKDVYGGVLGRGLGTMFLTAAIPTAISAILKANQDDEEEDPYFYNPNFFNVKHSDFLKLKAENTRISFFQGIDGNVVFLSRFISGEYMTSSSQQVRPLNGEGFNKDRRELAWDYISNKFAPTASVLVNYLGSDREKQESYERFQESLAPMWATGIGDQYDASGSLTETGALAVLGFFGLSYNNYGGAEFAKGRGTDNAKARAIFNKSGLSAYDPGKGQRTYWDGEKEVKVDGKVYKDKYLPAYQKFMTEAVLSSEDRLSPSKHWEVKEGVVDQLKKESYKYAEIKVSGINKDANFVKIGDGYRLLERQIPEKKKYIDEYMSRMAKREEGPAKREISSKLREDKVKFTDAYRDMLVELYLYNQANRYANEKLLTDVERGRIKLIKQSEYTSDMDSEDYIESDQ